MEKKAPHMEIYFNRKIYSNPFDFGCPKHGTLKEEDDDGISSKIGTKTGRTAQFIRGAPVDKVNVW